MVVGDDVVMFMKKLFVNWDFISSYVIGFLGVLVVGWTSSITLNNLFVVFSCLCIIVNSHALR